MVCERMQSERGRLPAGVPDVKAEPEADSVQRKVVAAKPEHKARGLRLRVPPCQHEARRLRLRYLRARN